MAHLLGLIVAVLLGLPLGVQAQTTVPPIVMYEVEGQPGHCLRSTDDAAAACRIADVAGWASWQGYTICDPTPQWPNGRPTVGPNQLRGPGRMVMVTRRWASEGCHDASAGGIVAVHVCADGSEPFRVGGVGPYVCEEPACAAGVQGSAKVFTESPPETFCSFGCTARIGMCMRMGEGGPLSCVTTLTGSSCVPTEHDPGEGRPDEVEDEDAVSCMEQGKTLGEVNGVRVCLDRGTPGGAETIDGNTTSQETEVDGSITKVDKTTTTITNIDGSVTVITTTVTTTGVGTPGESTSTEIDAFTGTKTQVCADRPNLPVCRSGGGGQGDGDGDGEGGEGEFAGTCAAGFQCEGDPIQCAIAKEQHIRACQLFEDETDESVVYANALAGDDPGDAALDPANAREVGLEGMIDDGGFLAGSCLDDLVVPLWDGQSLTVPFSELCPHLEFMGMIVVAFSMLAAARIMFV